MHVRGKARRIAVVTAAVALVLLVAVAAEGSPLRAGEWSDKAWTEGDGLRWVATAVVLVGVAGGTAVLVLSLRELRRGGFSGRRRRSLLANLLAFAVAIAILLLMPRPEPERRPPTTTTVVAPAEPELGGQPGGSGWALLPVAALAAVVAGTLLVATLIRRADDGDEALPPGPDGARSATITGIDASLDDLATLDDVRSAIVGAYARLLDALDGAGVPRRPAEAPLEYLVRALRSLDVRPEPLERLTALFNEARFSQHSLGPAARDAAFAALSAAREDLARTPAGAEVPR